MLLGAWCMCRAKRTRCRPPFPSYCRARWWCAQRATRCAGSVALSPVASRDSGLLQAVRELAQHAIGKHQAVGNGFGFARAAREATVRAEAIQRAFARDQRADLAG